MELLQYRAPRIRKDKAMSTIPIHSYIPRIICQKLEWITILTITVLESELNRAGWIQISKLSNLGALCLDISSTKDHGFDDVVIKAWANSARYSNGFPVLKFFHMQTLGGFEFDILAHLEAIESLRVFHWQTYISYWYRDSNCLANISVSDQSNWRRSEESDLCSELAILVGSLQNPNHIRTSGTIFNVISSWDANGRGDIRSKHPTLHVICGDGQLPVTHWRTECPEIWLEKVSQANPTDTSTDHLLDASVHDQPL
jgi:hypothetical protein